MGDNMFKTGICGFKIKPDRGFKAGDQGWNYIV